MSACGCGGAKCRLAAGDKRHGTWNGYGTNKCRCEPCREANRERQARWRAENPEKVREAAARYYAENAEKVRERCSRYYAENAEKVLESQARYRSENPEKGRERQARYRSKNAKKGLEPGDPRHGTLIGYGICRCRCEPCREAKREDKARYYAENTAKVLESLARYRATPEGKAVRRAASRRRRDRKRKRHCGCDTRENLHAVWVMDEGRCAYCGAEGTDYEHVVPLSRGGWGCISNFRIACKSCNSRKGTKPLSVFLERLAASGVDIRPGATNACLPCPAAAARIATRMLPAGSA